MKKLVLSTAAMLLGLGAIGVSHQAAPTFAEGEIDDLAALLSGYIDANGNYTKKSKIYLNEDAVAEAADFFHASSVSLTRTTYYDDDFNSGGALLMGDYDGGFTGINSGYATNGEGKLEHYRCTNVSAAGDGLFENRNSNYTLATTCNEFFDVLSGLADEVSSGSASDWSYADGIYTHTVPATITLDGDGNYNDILLKRFQYFAAPMLLQSAGATASNYLTFDSIEVEDKTDYLSIRLYLSSSNSGLVYTPVEGGKVLLAESRVYTGLSFFTMYSATINGVAAEANNIKTAGDNKAEFYFELEENDELVLFDGDTKMHYYHWDGEAIDDGDTYTATRKQYTNFYYNSSSQVYASVAAIDVLFRINEYDTHGGHAAVVGLDDDWANWRTMEWSEGNVWSLTIKLNIGYTSNWKFVVWDASEGNKWESDPNRWISVTYETNEIHDWNDHVS